ncbi:MAG: DNA polymerase, partial [Spirochaetes bacterium]
IMESSLSTEILTLDRVAKELIGKGKQDMEWSEIESAWREKENLEKIAEYCLKDSELALELGEKLLPQIFEICKIVGQTPFDISRMSYSQLVEWLLIRKAFQRGEVVPRRPKHEEIQKRRMSPPYTGGYVLEPKEGIYSNIALFDFRSLYPSIIITHNISPETLDCTICEECKRGESRKNTDPDGKHYYCTIRTGFIPQTIRELVEERMEIKKRMKKLDKTSEEYKKLKIRQHVLKIMANSSYGYYGYPGSRWYSRVCAQSAASWGRFYIKKVIEMAKAKGYTVIYGDTDSLFVKMKSKKEALEFLKETNASLPGLIELDFQGIYKSGIFVSAKTGGGAKKRYALMDFEGNITIRGFERVRRDWSKIAKITQERVLEVVLKDESPEKAVKMVKDVIDKLKRHEVRKEDLVIYSQITKRIGEYEQIGPHVIAAQKAIKAGRKIEVGSVISYIITKGPGSISSRAEPVDTAKDYDEEYYIKHQVIPAALRILSGLGYTEKDLYGEQEKGQTSLKGFLQK